MLTGQIMPIAAIGEAVKDSGARFLVDGALALGHVPVDVQALGCDYYAANFHKWSGGMPGTGVFYVRKGLAAEIPPLFGNAEAAEDGHIVSQMHSDEVRKFERGGRYDDSAVLALSEVVDLHARIGPERLRERLHDLSHRWTSRAERLPGFRAAASPDPAMSGSLVTWELQGRDSAAIARHLGLKKKVLLGTTDAFTGLFGDPKAKPRGLILTNTAMFTSEKEVDRFASLLEEVARSDLERS
jgi:selenocysteine lyase/cysteine desulfurase